MIGLRPYERDASLPGRAGEPHLAPIDEASLVALADAALRRPGSPRIEAARWEYARWRPGTSTCCAYALRFADGEERILVAKQYSGGRHRAVAARGQAAGAAMEGGDRLRPMAIVDERSVVLWGFPADRALLGHARIADSRSLARWIEESGAVPPRSIRRRRLRTRLLRYKPEHRSVWRLDLSLRAGSAAPATLALRALRPEHLERTLAARCAPSPLAGAGLGPAVRAFERREGLLLEEWLEGETFAPGSFHHAAAAGETLGRLHALSPGGGPASGAGESRDELLALFAVDPALLRRAAGAPAAPAPERRTWIHGDFHPDQVLRAAEGGWKLLDLDLAGIGDPAGDLAAWIADHLEESPGTDFAAAAEPLLAGYAESGAPPVAARRLAEATARELVRRAAGAIRRLEAGATDKARRLVAAALDLPACGAARR
ncbi:MAG: phosphotransferase [Planctomycetota bacterium]